MPITVVCQSCHKRFKVSEKFAGKKGPCPKCKHIIEIPKADEQVKIHVPEHSEGGARGRSGESVLKPIARKSAGLPVWAMIAIGVASLLLLLGAVLLRGASDSLRHIAAICGAIVSAPPLVLAGYTFLRNDELEPYTGLWLWIRTGICSALYIICWAVYGYLIPLEWRDELWKWAFLGPAFGVIGATTAFACFDLDFGSGFFHFAFYVGVTVLLGMTMGIGFLG